MPSNASNLYTAMPSAVYPSDYMYVYINGNLYKILLIVCKITITVFYSYFYKCSFTQKGEMKYK